MGLCQAFRLITKHVLQSRMRFRFRDTHTICLVRKYVRTEKELLAWREERVPSFAPELAAAKTF